jgi:FtsH-binding integral membrane protein
MSSPDGSAEPRPDAIEHGASSTALWLRERRVRTALWIGLIEGLLVIFHVIDKWIAIGVAIVVLAIYFFFGRNSSSPTVRQVSWVAAASQAVLILVPIVVAIIPTVALILVAIIAVVALVALFAERPS